MSAYIHHLSERADALYPHLKSGFKSLDISGWDSRLSAGIVLLLSLLYPLGVVIYNLFFSPIARFPGPKLAAATGLYEFYYDFFKRGRYIFEIERMHAKYGQWRPGPEVASDIHLTMVVFA